MKPNTTLTLTPLDGNGNPGTPFVFANTEIPEYIPFGGEQLLAVHQLIGGSRQVDAMGRSDMPLEWSGVFLGQAALGRARYLDYLRSQGSRCILNWSELSYLVLIQQLQFYFERFYQLPYQISCLVVADNAKPQVIAPASIDQAIGDDMNSGLSLGGLIGDGPLSSALANVQSAVKAVTTFASAAQSTIQTVIAPIQAVQARVQTLIASTGNTLLNVSTLGGLLPGNPVSSQISGFLGQAANLQQLPMLYQLDSVMGRMSGNLNAINSTGGSLTVAGGNLMKVAQQLYGDATDWTTVAQANNLQDPVVSGVNTLTVPKKAVSNGGILSP